RECNYKLEQILLVCPALLLRPLPTPVLRQVHGHLHRDLRLLLHAHQLLQPLPHPRRSPSSRTRPRSTCSSLRARLRRATPLCR
ncbi:unnamed protein product, partial [Amoebophrya sp. A25]